MATVAAVRKAFIRDIKPPHYSNMVKLGKGKHGVLMVPSNNFHCKATITVSSCSNSSRNSP